MTIHIDCNQTRQAQELEALRYMELNPVPDAFPSERNFVEAEMKAMKKRIDDQAAEIEDLKNRLRIQDDEIKDLKNQIRIKDAEISRLQKQTCIIL